jgi:flagellar biosynthesis protein FlhA
MVVKIKMFDEKRQEYIVRTCSNDDANALEALLNEMSGSGWELYSLNEIEIEDGEYSYLCIFNRESKGGYGLEDEYFVDTGDFKTRMQKLLHKRDDLYKECRFLQQQIREKNYKIKEIKDLLESGSDDVNRQILNEEILKRLNELNTLKSKFSELLSPSNMYKRINQDILKISVSQELSELVDNEKDGDLIAESIKLRQKLTDDLGYVIPRIHFLISDELNENEYSISVRNLKTVKGTAYPGYRRLFIGQSNLGKAPEDAIEDVDPISGKEVFWLETEKTKHFWDNGLSASQVITSHLNHIVCKYVDEILSYNDIINYIALLGEENAFLADDLIQGGMSIKDLRYVFVELIREKVSVRDLIYIFEKLNDLSEEEYDNQKLVEELRFCIKRQICNSIADSANNIHAISIPEHHNNTIEKLFENEKSDFAESEDLSEFIKYVTETYLGYDYESRKIALISQPEYRKALFILFESILPDLYVISENEITEEFNVEII